MSKRVLHDLQKLFKRYECTVDKFEVSSRNLLKVWLRAPDGVGVELMAFSNETGSATKYAQGNEQMVRRFALAHPKPVVRPVGITTTKHFILKPYQGEAVRVLTNTNPPPSYPRPPAPPTPPTITAEPMPTTVTTPIESSASLEKKQKRQLDRKEVHQLWKWCRENVPQGLETTVFNLAAEASKSLGFPISEYTMAEALQLEEITLAEPKKELPQDRAWVLACVLKGLFVELKMDPPPALLALCERRKAKP